MNEKAVLEDFPRYIDVVPSHVPNRRAQLADRYLRAMLESSGMKTFDVGPEHFGRIVDVLSGISCALAEKMEHEWERRGWMIEVKPEETKGKT